jgi:outer membrane receptor protein involved in Fe transport
LGYSHKVFEDWEAQLYYNAKDDFAVLTFYHIKMEEIVTRQILSTGVFQFINSHEIDFNGIELKDKANIKNQWRLNGSISWQENEDSLDVKDTTFTPNWMGKLGVFYKPNTKYQFSLFDSYFGKPTQISELNQAVSEVNRKPEYYHLVTANAIFNLNTILKLKTSSDLKF